MNQIAEIGNWNSLKFDLRGLVQRTDGGPGEGPGPGDARPLRRLGSGAWPGVGGLGGDWSPWTTLVTRLAGNGSVGQT